MAVGWGAAAAVAAADDAGMMDGFLATTVPQIKLENTADVVSRSGQNAHGKQRSISILKLSQVFIQVENAMCILIPDHHIVS